MSNIFVHIGENISDYLKENQMSQSELAEKIGVSKQVMSKIINGKKAINIDEIKRIASVINLKIDDLINNNFVSEDIEPVLIMMGNVGNVKTKDDLRFLNHVMDEMINLEKLLGR